MRHAYRHLREVVALSAIVACTKTHSPAPSSASVTPPAVLPHRTYTLQSTALGELRRINLYTPPGYDESPSARYPLLYMPDGGVDEDFPHVVAAVDKAIRAGEMRPTIVVGIENTERRRDTTGPTTVESDRKIAPHVGGSAAFRRFFADELMPDVQKRVRTDGHSSIIGESLVGLFIVETFFVAPEMFDTYIALSPSLWWNDQALVRGEPAWRAAHPSLAKTLYLTVGGDDDRGDAIARLAAELKADPPAGLTFLYEPRPSATHATIYAAAEAPVLRQLFPPNK